MVLQIYEQKIRFNAIYKYLSLPFSELNLTPLIFDVPYTT